MIFRTRKEKEVEAELGLDQRTDVQLALHPAFVKGVPHHMAAIVAHVIGIPGLTKPSIREMGVTSDGAVMASVHEDPSGRHRHLTSYEELEEEWTQYLDGLELDSRMRHLAEGLFRARMKVL